MLPIIGGLISGGASLLGNIFSANTSAANTQQQLMGQEWQQMQSEQYNAQQAQINRDFQASQVQQQEGFQEQMSNTAYQRASADMKKAGLNPMMMFGSGGPASAPSGAAASGSTASVGTPNVPMPSRVSPMANFGDVVNKAMSSAAGVQELAKSAEQTDLVHNQAQEAGAKARSAAADATIREREVAGGVAKADRAAREEGYLAEVKPAEQRAAAQSPYVGKAYGNWGSEIATPAKTVINGLTSAVSDLINQATGPSGQQMWKRVRQGWNTAGDWQDAAKLRGTTLNNDYQ